MRDAAGGGGSSRGFLGGGLDEILRRCAPQDDGEPKSETQLQVEATLTSKRGPSSGQRPALCRDDNVNRNGRRRRHASFLSAGSRRTPRFSAERPAIRRTPDSAAIGWRWALLIFRRWGLVVGLRRGRGRGI